MLRSEPAQGNLLHKGASQNGAVSACVMHGAAIGCEPTRWSQLTRSCWPKQMEYWRRADVHPGRHARKADENYDQTRLDHARTGPVRYKRVYEALHG